MGSDSAIDGHFSETAIPYDLGTKSGRVSTPVTPFFRSTHGSGDQTKFGSDSAIGGHFSETAILYDLWAKNGRVSTPVISLGYPLAGERFGSVFSHVRAFFRLSADGILCPRAILTRAPDFSVSFLHFVLPDTGKGTGGRFGHPNQAPI